MSVTAQNMVLDNKLNIYCTLYTLNSKITDILYESK